MADERIKVKTENGQVLDVVVLSKRAEVIQVVLGEGVHSVKVSLSPTRNNLAYAGSVMAKAAQFQKDIEFLEEN